MSEKENIIQQISDENSECFIVPKASEYDEEPKTPEMSFNLNDDKYYNISIKSQNDDKNNKEETSLKMSETKVTSKTLDEKAQIEIIPSINNICVTVDLHCKLNLRKIAKKTLNSEYNPKKSNFLIMRLKNQKGFANFSESGKMVCSGADSEEALKKKLIEYNNKIKSCGYSTKLNLEEISINYISATCDIKFRIPLSKLLIYLDNLKENDVNINYEPEIFPGLIYRKKVDNSNMVITFFSSGKINITGAKKKEHIYNIFNQIYPELLKFKNQL